MNAPNPSGWRPELGPADNARAVTASGDRGLMLEEPRVLEGDVERRDVSEA